VKSSHASAVRARGYDGTMRKPITSLLVVVSLVALAEDARAGNACANLDIAASTVCTVSLDGDCSAKCNGVAYEASCETELYASCAGQCNASAQASCTGNCQASCTTQCNLTPAVFECSGNCKATCKADCSVECAGRADSAQCNARCGGYCSAQCDASCQAVAPTASCSTKCAASCQGSCAAEVNTTCHMNCQAAGFTSCSTSLKGLCVGDCEATGAISCGGQYVNAADTEACASYLQTLGISVMLRVQASGSARCAVSPGGGSVEGWAGVLLTLLGVWSVRRRRLGR
jgi:hypothetical protein